MRRPEFWTGWYMLNDGTATKGGRNNLLLQFYISEAHIEELNNKFGSNSLRFSFLSFFLLTIGTCVSKMFF